MENVLDVLRSGIDSALLGLGRASVARAEPVRPADPRWLRTPAWRLSADLRGGAGPARRAARRDRAARAAPAAGHRHGHRRRACAVVARATRSIAPALPYGSSGEHAGFAGDAVDRPGGARARARRARSLARTFARVLFVSRARRQRRAARRRGAGTARRGPRRVGLVASLGRRRPRRSNRDLADARARARARRSRARRRETSRRSPSCCRACAPRASARSARTACSATRPARPPRRATRCWPPRSPTSRAFARSDSHRIGGTSHHSEARG